MAYQIAQGDTLSGIATANKTTVQDILKLNPTITDPNKILAGASLNLPTAAPTVAPTIGLSGQDFTSNPNFVPNQVLPPGGYTPQPPSKIITPDSLTGATAIQIPPAPTDNSSQADATAAGAKTQMEQTMAEYAPPPSTTETQIKSLYDSSTTNLGLEAKLPDAQIAAEQAAGIPDTQKQIATINTQVLTKTAEIDAMTKAYEKANLVTEGQAINQGNVQGQQANNYKMYLAEKNAKASEIGILQAQALGLQGQVDAAQKTVDHSIDLKYKALELQNATLKNQIDSLIPTLNKEEKQVAFAQKVLLDQKTQDLADQKDKEKQQATYVYDMMGKYGDAGILPTDSYQTIQTKIQGSKIYQDQVRAPVSSSNNKSSTNIYSATNIPTAIKTDLIDDISSGYTANQLYSAYPEVNTEYINSLMGTVEQKPTSETTQNTQTSTTKEVKWWNPLTWF